MKKHFILIICYLLAGKAWTQVEEQVLPTDLKQQTIITQPVTLYKGFFRIGFTGTYGVLDRRFTEDGDKVYFPENGTGTSWDLRLTGQYGITDRLEVTTRIPFRFERLAVSSLLEIPAVDTMVVFKFNNTGFGLSDLELGVNYQLLTENESRPALVGKFGVILPTGEKNPTNVVDQDNYDLPPGDGKVTFTGDLIMRRVRYPFSYTAFVGFAYHLEGEKMFEPNGPNLKFKTANLFDVGGSFNFHLNEWLAIENEVFLFIFGESEVDGVKSGSNPWSLQYIPRVNFQIKRFRLIEALSVPVAGKSTAADIGYFLILQYVI